jgi:hypothetical protein
VVVVRSYALPVRRAHSPRGLHDRALLLVGFGALRRSELAGLTLDQATDHARGERPSGSKTNRHGTDYELVVCSPAPGDPTCPLNA